MKRFRPLAMPAIVFLSLLLTLCSNNTRIAGGASETENVTGKLRITLGDSPPPKGVDHLYMDLHAVQVFSDSLGWITASILDTVVDLVDLSQGGKVVLADTMLPVGSYTQLRVVFGSKNSVTIDGKNHVLGASAIVDSGAVVPLDFFLAADQDMELYIDIDAAKSVNWTLPVPELDPALRPFVIPDCGFVTGTVRDQRGNPIQAARIRALAGDSILGSTSSDSTGRYSLILPAAVCTLVCEADAFGPSNPERHLLQIAAGDSVAGKDFRMADRIRVQLGLIYGTVKDSLSNPIAGASIQAWAGSTLAASRSTDSAGFYLLTLTAGDYVLTCSANGFLPDTLEVRIAAGDSIGLSDFSMKKVAATPAPRAIIWGHVSANQAPVSGSMIEAWTTNDLSELVTSDSAGFYRLVLTPGAYQLACSSAGMISDSTAVALENGDSANVDFELLPQQPAKTEGLIAGVVSDTNGKPLGLALVTLRDDSGNVLACTTNAAGDYARTLSLGHYGVACSAQGYVAKTIPVSLGLIDTVFVNFSLAPIPVIPITGLLQGSVLSQNGIPLAGASVIALVSGTAVGTTQTDPTGAFSLLLPPAQYTVKVTATGYQARSITANIPANDTTDLTVSMTSIYGLVTGTVVDKKRRPMGFVSVVAALGGKVVATALSNEDGVFQLTVMQGSYAISCSTQAYQYSVPQSRSVEIRGGDTLGAINFEVRNDLSAGYTFVSGLVRDSLGRRLAGAVVTGECCGGATVAQYTDMGGHFRIILEPGEYHLTCTAEGYDRSDPDSYEITARAGSEIENRSFRMLVDTAED